MTTCVAVCPPTPTMCVPAFSNKIVRGVKMPAAVIQRIPELKSFSESRMQVSRCTQTTRNGVSVPALKRPIDLVLLSIGGNDVGFTQLVADSILSDASIYRRLGKAMGNHVFGVETARARLDLLKKRFDGLKYALDLFFDLGPHAKVIMTGYDRARWLIERNRPAMQMMADELLQNESLEADDIKRILSTTNARA